MKVFSRLLNYIEVGICNGRPMNRIEKRALRCQYHAAEVLYIVNESDASIYIHHSF